MRDAPAVPSTGCMDWIGVAGLAARLGALVTDPALRAAADAVMAGLRDKPASDAALDRLLDGYALSAFERDLVVLAGLPEEHEVLSHVARLRHPMGEPWLTPGGLADALALDPAGRSHLRRAVEAGPLHEYGILGFAPGLPFPEQSVRLAPGLWSVLRGCDRWPTELARVATVPATGERLGHLGAAIARGVPVVVMVTGPADRTARELAGRVACELDQAGVPGVFLDAAGLDAERSRLASVHAVVRGAVPVLVGRPSMSPLPSHPGPVVVCAPTGAGLSLDGRPTLTIDLGARSLAESVAMWDALLPGRNGEARTLAGLLRVDPVRAREAVADAHALVSFTGAQLDDQVVVDQARRRTDCALPSTVRLMRPTATWSDLVTTPANEALLQSVVDRIHGQVRVLHDWGFGRLGRGRGARVLLAGPPGTGKTLSARILAAELGLDLLVVDLSALVSKWVGETEKNIAEVFDAAERSQAVLFFDEADALFGRRTDANDAQARWANLETAYLLSRVDTFDGLVVLATNLRANIDEAFVRRLDVVVEFDEPTAEERRRLWHLHLPPAAPRDPDVDLDQLATLYPVTGGLVSNASLAAAFAAAAEATPISQTHLIVALEREYRKAGRTFPGKPRGLTTTRSGGQ